MDLVHRESANHAGLDPEFASVLEARCSYKSCSMGTCTWGGTDYIYFKPFRMAEFLLCNNMTVTGRMDDWFNLYRHWFALFFLCQCARKAGRSHDVTRGGQRECKVVTCCYIVHPTECNAVSVLCQDGEWVASKGICNPHAPWRLCSPRFQHFGKGRGCCERQKICLNEWHSFLQILLIQIWTGCTLSTYLHLSPNNVLLFTQLCAQNCHKSRKAGLFRNYWTSIIGTSDLGLVKDTPGWPSPISSCVGPPWTSPNSSGVRLRLDMLDFFWFAERHCFFKNLVRHGPFAKQLWHRNELAEIY